MPRPIRDESRKSIHTRRLVGVQHERVRVLMDVYFTDALDDLSDAYRGTPQFNAKGEYVNRIEDGWRHGVSHPVTIGGSVFDKGSDLVSSKLLFDRLHGLIHHHLFLARIEQNTALPLGEQYRVDSMDTPIMDDQEQPTGLRTSSISHAYIAEMALLGLTIDILWKDV